MRPTNGRPFCRLRGTRPHAAVWRLFRIPSCTVRAPTLCFQLLATVSVTKMFKGFILSQHMIIYVWYDDDPLDFLRPVVFFISSVAAYYEVCVCVVILK